VSKEYDLSMLLLQYHEAGNTAVFFVKGKSVALAIAGTSERVTLPDSSKVSQCRKIALEINDDQTHY